jgi:hypothetical protein
VGGGAGTEVVYLEKRRVWMESGPGDRCPDLPYSVQPVSWLGLVLFMSQ